MTMTQYGTAQKLSLAGVVLGAIMIAVGGGAPYWLITDLESLGFWGSLFNKMVKANMGPFMYCLAVLENTECHLFSLESISSIPIIDKEIKNSSIVQWFIAVGILTAVCMGVSVLCGLAALCLACCSCCERLIVLGLMVFVAAGCGVSSAVIFYLRTEDFTQVILGFRVFSLGWAFFVFCVGVGLLFLVSFVACFASPEISSRVHAGMVMQPTRVTTITTHPSTQMAFVNTPSVAYTPGAMHPHSVPNGACPNSKF